MNAGEHIALMGALYGSPPTFAELVAELESVQAAVERGFAHFERDASPRNLAELRRVLVAAERHCQRVAAAMEAGNG